MSRSADPKVPIDALALNPFGAAIARSKWKWEPSYRHVNDAPVAATRLPDGELYLLDGYHRVEQARRDGRHTVPVRVIPLTKELHERVLRELGRDLVSEERP